MKIQALFPRQNFTFEALGEENANAGNVNNNPPANGAKEAPPAETKNKDNSRKGLDDQAKILGKGMGVLFGKSPTTDAEDPIGAGKVLALPGKIEKVALMLCGWLFGLPPFIILDTFGGSINGKSYTRKFTEETLGAHGVDVNKKEERNIYGPAPKPIEEELDYLPENDPLRAELKEAQDLFKIYEHPDEDSDWGVDRKHGAEMNLSRVEDKIRKRAEAIQQEINELPHSIKSAKSSEAILKDYQERLARLNHLVETETRPHKLDDWLKALERLESQYPTLQRWLELKDIYDKQQKKKESRSNGVTYDLPANDKVGLLTEPGTESQFALASNSSNPLSGVRPIPMTYDLHVNNKLTGLIAQPVPQQQTAMSSANSNVVIQTAPQAPSEKQNPLFGVRPIPMTYDLPVNNKIAGLTLAPIPQQQPVLSKQNLNIVPQGQLSVSNQSVANLNNSDEKAKALAVQIQLKAKGLLA